MPPAAAGVRRARGERRRDEILRATLAIAARDGVDAVSHRAIAAEAGVPLAATTYYFASRDELIAEALALAVEEEVATFEAGVAAAEDPTGPAEAADALTTLIEQELARDPLGLLAKYELYLAAARRPALRPVARRWTDAYHAYAERLLAALGVPEPAAGARLLVATLDGTLHERMAEGRGDADELRARLRRLLTALAPAPPAGPPPH